MIWAYIAFVSAVGASCGAAVANASAVHVPRIMRRRDHWRRSAVFIAVGATGGGAAGVAVAILIEIAGRIS